MATPCRCLKRELTVTIWDKTRLLWEILGGAFWEQIAEWKWMIEAWSIYLYKPMTIDALFMLNINSQIWNINNYPKLRFLYSDSNISKESKRESLSFLIGWNKWCYQYGLQYHHWYRAGIVITVPSSETHQNVNNFRGIADWLVNIAWLMPHI